MTLEVGKVYKSLAGCPVKLIETFMARDEARIMANVEYMSPTNNYNYGKGTTGWFYGSDLREWNAAIDGDPYQ